jgi:alkylhydroperoxidase family enzyme
LGVPTEELADFRSRIRLCPVAVTNGAWPVSYGVRRWQLGVTMSRTPRVPKVPITGPLGYAVRRFSRKMLGDVPDGVGVMWQNRPVLMALIGFSRKAEKWHKLDANLKSFAHLAAAARVGCSACLDFGYLQVHIQGLDEAKASEVPRWRESTVFTSLERDVIEYAEAMTDTPTRVTDELFDRVFAQLGAPAMVELSAVVAAANMAARNNTALGIESQGFSKVCALPLAQPSAVSKTSA